MAKINKYLEILLQQQDLTFDQSRSLLDTVFDGETPPAQVAAFLTAMRIKGTKSAELAGLASSLRNHAVRVETGMDNLIDTCGTGGARLKSFNISTAAAIVAAGAGACVAKHGNRGITSKCGSADVLAALGVKIDCGADRVVQCIRDAHIGFMFAPMFHPAMKYVQPIRKELDFRTVFNILGPLANPAFATAQVMGVPDETLMPTITRTLDMLDVKRAMVVHSEGLDEISTLGPTKVLHLKDGKTTGSTLDPSDYGIAPADFQVLQGGDAQTNAAIVKGILSGEDTGPRKDIVVLNAAAAIIVAGLADEFAQAIKIADESIADGKAEEALEKMITISNA